MTRYRGPQTIKGDIYQGKFVRVGDKVAIGPDNDSRLSHAEIAQKERLLAGLRTLVTETPIETDAGLMSVYKGYGNRPGRIMIIHHSMTLGLPTMPEARTRSGEVLEQLSPGYQVEIEMPPSKERR